MADNIKLEWKNEFKGVMTSPNGQVLVGSEQGEMMPYHLLFGALGSCFHATFLSIANKKRLTFEGATVEVSGNKKTSEPATLEYVLMQVVIKNPSDEKQILRSVELGAKYCSIHETISKVAKIDIDVKFEY